MRINKWLAAHTHLSRRKADDAITSGKITINDRIAQLGDEVGDSDIVKIAGIRIEQHTTPFSYILLNKPVGYVCSRSGQGSKTIFELLPQNLHSLEPVGRLDKDSSGLLLMTDDGEWLNTMAHPSHNKQKIYNVRLDKPLTPTDTAQLSKGVLIGDERASYIVVHPIREAGASSADYRVHISEGRNRQIRRTFEALGHRVITLHRVQFGRYMIEDLALGSYRQVQPD